MRNSSGGSRQRAWTALLERPFETVAALARHVDCTPEGLRSYVAALERRGYVRFEDDWTVVMVKPTGPRAPSWSAHTDEFRDWNLDPAMSGAELEAAIKASGLSLAAWLRANGRHEAGSTRLRQMINGQRPVSEEIAGLARNAPVERVSPRPAPAEIAIGEATAQESMARPIRQ